MTRLARKTRVYVRSTFYSVPFNEQVESEKSYGIVRSTSFALFDEASDLCFFSTLFAYQTEISRIRTAGTEEISVKKDLQKASVV